MPPKLQIQTKEEYVPPGPEISSAEWGMVIGALALIDLIEIALDVFAVGLALDTIIDPGVGIAFGLYLVTRVKVEGLTGWFLAALAGEAVPGLNALPLWTLDGFYSYYKYKKSSLAP